MKKHRRSTAFVPKMVLHGVWASVVPACARSGAVNPQHQQIVLAMVAFDARTVPEPQAQPIVLAMVAFEHRPDANAFDAAIDASPAPAARGDASVPNADGGRRGSRRSRPVPVPVNRERVLGVANVGFDHDDPRGNPIER